MREDSKGNILIVEDDMDINGLLHKVLVKNGYDTRQAFSGSEGKMCLELYDYHLVLLDLMLPGITGEEFIEEIRKIKNTPIIVVSAKTDVFDKVNVLKLGADDFVTKPFNIDELLARVEAQIRRNKLIESKENNEDKLIYKNLEMDIRGREARVNGENLTLTAKEYKILEILVKNSKRVFTKANLFELVWEEEFFGDDNTINVHMSNLRNKISELDSENDYIKTIWGVGFKME